MLALFLLVIKLVEEPTTDIVVISGLDFFGRCYVGVDVTWSLQALNIEFDWLGARLNNQENPIKGGDKGYVK